MFQLEAELGVPLFERSPRGVTLTADGECLYEAVRLSLDTLRGATATLRARREHGALTIVTDFGFATYWLMPRLAGLKRVMPDVDVRVVTSQDYDAQRDHGDIAILFGDGHWPSHCRTALSGIGHARLLARVPRRAPARRAGRTPAGLPLLHVQPTRPERWLSWSGWFDAHGLDTAAARAA